MLRPTAGLMISALLHGALLAAIVFEVDLFGADPGPEVEFVEAQIFTAEEFAELVGGPEPAPEEILASAPVPEEAPPPPEPEVAATPAPYETAPSAPTPLTFDPAVASDAPVEDAIREALPKPRVAAPAPAPTPPPTAESDPELDVTSDTPPEPAPPPESPRPRIASAPPKPEAAVRDRTPTPDTPDTPPEEETAAAPEPEPEPEVAPEEVAAAPETAPAPRTRPRRSAEAPDAAPEEPRPTPPTRTVEAPARTTERTTGPVTGPPLNQRERDGLRFALTRCWSRPALAGVDPATMVVRVRFDLRRDGRLVGRPFVVSPTRLENLRQRAAVVAAQRAVLRCQPYSGLPAAKYDSWRQIIVTFDPREESVGVR